MKKVVLIIAACCYCGVLTISAQSSSQTNEEQVFRNGIERFLREEGFVPTIDTDDNSINFKREGESYWINVFGASPVYIEMHKSGFGLEDTKREYLIEACNKASNETRCAKAYVTQTSVSFSVEVFCHSIEGFRKNFYSYIRTLDLAKTSTKEYYNELDK